MLKLVKICKGKETVIDTGDRSKLNDKLKQMRSSAIRGKTGGHRTNRVRYEIRDSNSQD